MKKNILLALILSFCLLTVGAVPSMALTNDYSGNKTISVYNAFKSAKQARLKAKSGLSSISDFGELNKKAVSPSSSYSEVDQWIFLDGPDGTVWYALGDFDFTEIPHEHYTDYILRKFKYTIYDSKFQEIGSIQDEIEYKEGETKAALSDLASVVTTKFFNYDNNYEVLFILGVNTGTNENRYYTKVYSINGAKDENGDDKCLAEIEGLYADAVNAAPDQWSENFYLSFLTYEIGNADDYDDSTEYAMSYKNIISTYRKATYSGEYQLLNRVAIPEPASPGDQQNTPLMVSFVKDKRAYFAYQRYRKSFLEEPLNIENENLSEDNYLDIEVYSAGSGESEMRLECTTSIPTEQPIGDPSLLCTYYSIGKLGYDRDVVIDGENFKFLVAQEELYAANDEDLVRSYYLYNSDGEKEITVAEEIDGVVMLSDIPNHEAQYMFVSVSQMGYVFTFKDFPSCETKTVIPNTLDGLTLSAALDRVPSGSSYKYAFKVMNPIDENGDAIERIAWLDADGALLSVDKVNLGQKVAYASIYLNQSVLSPYFMNTDEEHEYMILLKRYRSIGSGTDEEFVICQANTGETLMRLTPDAEKGTLISVMPITVGEKNLILLYSKDEGYSVDVYPLPLTKFAGGTGTAEDPYLIATAGDFGQIGKSLSAHYKIVADIDFSDYALTAVPGEFSGTLDGNGKTLSNITLDGVSGIFSGLTMQSVVKNLNIVGVKVNCSAEVPLSGVLSPSALGSRIENVHVYALDVKGDEDADPIFGGLVGRATNNSIVTGCSVNGVINLPQASIGGVLGTTFTGSIVRASSFVGTIVGNSEVGGITGYSTSADDEISDCHVDAAITANNTVGGIVGSSTRATISRCYVEGSIKALANTSRWADYGPCAGGIVGVLSPLYNNTDPEGEGSAQPQNTKVISGCFVNLTSLEGFVSDGPLNYESERSTIHRIVGRSSVNFEPEVIDYDDDYNPIYGDLREAEHALSDNYAIATLTLGDAGAQAGAITVEGEAVDADKLSSDWFAASLGFKYGAAEATPWNEVAEYDPALYHELTAIVTPAEISVMEGRVFSTGVLIVRAVPFTAEEFMDNFSCEMSDESVVEMTGNFSYEGSIASIEWRAMKPGKSTITMFGAKCEVTVVEDPTTSIDGIVNDGNSAVIERTADGISVTNVAEGESVEVYTLSGIRMFATVATTTTVDINLPEGLYIVRIGSSAVKCMVK